MSWDFGGQQMHKARKEHQCEECCCMIPLGTVYERTTGRYEGMFFSYATCPKCVRLYQLAQKKYHDWDWGEFPVGELRERIREEVQSRLWGLQNKWKKQGLFQQMTENREDSGT